MALGSLSIIKNVSFNFDHSFIIEYLKLLYDESEFKFFLNKTDHEKQLQSGLRESSLKFLKRNKLIDNEAGKELRYSPTSLECLLNAGINYLDTLNTSAVQLEELDKIRCIGLAQQETVALAHLIKDQQNTLALKQDEAKARSKEPVVCSKSYDTSDFESNEETYEAKVNKIEKPAKPAKPAILKQSIMKTDKQPPRAVSLSSTLSSSSYSDLNDNTETNDVTSGTTTRKNQSIQEQLLLRSSKTHDEQDLSMINTVSELTGDKDNKGSTCDEDDELEKSFRQLLPSESHLKKNKLEMRGDHSLLYMNDMSQTSFSQLDSNQPNGKDIHFEFSILIKIRYKSG